MAEAGTKLQVKTEENASERPGTLKARRPFQTLRRGIDQFLEDFQLDFLRSAFRRSVFDVEPFWQHDRTRGATPAVDIVEKDTAYEVTADLPGLEKKSIEVKVVKGNLTIKGGKQEIKEEQKKTTISVNASSAPSSAASGFRRVSIPTRSRRASSRES